MEKVLLNSSAERIFSFLTLHSGISFYDKEISEKTGLSRGTTNRLLNSFLKAGLVDRERRGRMWFYSLRQTPLPKQFRIYENLVVLNDLVQALKPLVQKLILFGSAASGTDSAESDVDLFVITRQKEEVIKKIRNYESDREIAPIVQTANEYAVSRSKDKAFHNQVAEGITLYESEPDEQRL